MLKQLSRFLVALIISIVIAESIIVYINTKEFEGLRLHVYSDSVGKKTIGYGHNLQGGNDRNVRAIGLNPQDLISGRVSLTLAQADALFDLDMSDSRRDATDLVPQLGSMPEPAQECILDLVFNMGKGGFGQFHRTLGDLNRWDFPQASRDLKNSGWYTEVGHRAVVVTSVLSQVPAGKPMISTAGKPINNNTPIPVNQLGQQKYQVARNPIIKLIIQIVLDIFKKKS